MANNLEYTLSLDSSDFTKGVKEAENQLDSLGKTAKGESGKGILGNLIIFEILKKGLEIVKEFFRESISAALESVRINAAWSNAMRTVGANTKEASVYIEEMSKTNAVEEDEIKQIQSYGLSIGVTKEKLKQFTQTTIDYAAQSGRGIEFSMRKVATLATTNSREFDSLSKRVKGAGEEYANADYGIKSLSVSWKEFTENVGKSLLTTLGPLINYLKSIIDYFDELIKKSNEQEQKNKNLTTLTQRPKDIEKLKETNKELEKGIKEGAFIGNTLIQVQKEIKKNEADITKYEKEIKDAKTGQVPLYKVTRDLTQDELKQLKLQTEEKIKQLNIYIQIIEKIAGNNEQLKESISKLKNIYSIISNIQKEQEDLKAATDAVTRSEKEATIAAEGLLIIFQVLSDLLNGLQKIIQQGNETANQLNTDAMTKSIEESNLAMETLNTQMSQMNDSINEAKNAFDRLNKTPAQSSQDIQERIDALNTLMETEQAEVDQNITNAGNRTKAELQAQKLENQGTINAVNEENRKLEEQKKSHGDIWGTIQKQIDANKRKIELINNQNTALDTQISGLDANTGLTQTLLDQNEELLALQKEQLIIDDQKNIERKDLEESLTNELLKNADQATADSLNEKLKGIIQSKIDSLNDILANETDVTEQLNTQIKIAQEQNKLQETQNSLLDKKISKLKNMIDLGLVDVQSFKGVNYLAGQLSAQGITGINAATQLSGLGVRSDTIRQGANIGQINVTNFEANLNTLSGSIAQAISNRIM